MALVPIDSTNFTVAVDAVSTVNFGPGYRGLEIVSLNGGGTVGYRFDTTTNMSSTDAFAADNWLLPPVVGVARSHSLDTEDDEGSAPAFYFEAVASNGTCSVSVTAWV